MKRAEETGSPASKGQDEEQETADGGAPRRK